MRLFGRLVGFEDKLISEHKAFNQKLLNLRAGYQDKIDFGFDKKKIGEKFKRDTENLLASHASRVGKIAGKNIAEKRRAFYNARAVVAAHYNILKLQAPAGEKITPTIAAKADGKPLQELSPSQLYWNAPQVLYDKNPVVARRKESWLSSIKKRLGLESGMKSEWERRVAREKARIAKSRQIRSR